MENSKLTNGKVLQEECPEMYNRGICIPPAPERPAGMPHFLTGMTVGRQEPVRNNGQDIRINDRIDLSQEMVQLEQKLVPSTGTKIVCTTCGRQNWHTLMLRRKAGLIEGLCKQEDGSGCYPLASRRNCTYTYPEQIDCPQVAEYCVAVGSERRSPRPCCRDHVGEMLRQGPLYQVWPLED